VGVRSGGPVRRARAAAVAIATPRLRNVLERSSDEVQRAPDPPSYLQEIIDDDPKPGRWFLTGSRKLLLLESVSPMTRP
jgi:hypothetical protein